jgi:tRNA dimethylallyltransferase
MIEPSVKLVALVGPTAAGKTELAVALAKQFGGEIICADSRTVYRGMAIGAAKPSVADQSRVPHHLLDIVEPNEPISAAEFKRLAEGKVLEIFERGNVPFLVGGSGLYVHSVLYDYNFPAGPRTAERAALEGLELAELVGRLKKLDPERAREIDLKNKRRVVRALETAGRPRQRRTELPRNCLLLGLKPDAQSLHTKIVRRTRAMFKMGLVAEVERLVNRYGEKLEALRSPGYAEIVRMLRGEITQAQAEELVILHTQQLAKRQMTWFKRNIEIQWLDDSRQAEELVRTSLHHKEV